MTISLDGLRPKAELPAGHFYYLRASFASSDGNNYNAGICSINIVTPNKHYYWALCTKPSKHYLLG
ncbi:hypothetical protein AX660_11675 [Paraglaciecola hydrolytica]|uniref:Uncharacterized protein n=1 Tax=Paraglaciecola hydrolytica TaxID=1799789 RepID=A0A136A0R2_9ALTE|nr:hypothetical protein AX660_11675 [Paraglaciecola hydrolytica]